MIAQEGPQEFHDLGRPWMLVDPTSTGWFPSQNRNRLFDLGVCGCEASDEIAKAESLFRERGVERFFTFVDPVKPIDCVVKELESRGHKFANVSHVLSRVLEDLPDVESRFSVRMASASELGAVEQVLTCGGTRAPVFPDVSLAALHSQDAAVFLVWHGEEPVAVGLVFCLGGLAYLSNATTLHQYRGQGAHKALVRSRLEWSLGHGCTDAVAESYSFVPESYENLKKLGFSDLYDRQIFRFETGC